MLMSHFPFKSVTFLAPNGEQSHEVFFFLIEILFLDNLQCENIPFLSRVPMFESKSKTHSVVSDSETPWTIESMGFSRPEY